MPETATLSLSEFLLARIAEDVDVLTRSESFQHATHGDDAMGTFSPTCPTCRQFVWGTRDRALVECEAKRRIIEMMRGNYSENDVEYWALDDALQFLAAPYADHPDFRPEWRS